MESYVKVKPLDLLSLVNNKRKRLQELQNQEIEKHIEINTHKRHGLLGKDKTRSREEVIASLDESFVDGNSTLREYVCSYSKTLMHQLDIIEAMVDTAEQSSDKLIRLSKSDNHFLNT